MQQQPRVGVGPTPLQLSLEGAGESVHKHRAPPGTKGQPHLPDIRSPATAVIRQQQLREQHCNSSNQAIAAEGAASQQQQRG